MNGRHLITLAALALLPACSSSNPVEPIYSINVSGGNITLSLGGASPTQTLNATVTQKLGANSVVDNTSPITWATSDSKVATVAGNGRSATVTAVGPGTATITATVQNVHASIDVTVVAGPLTGTVATSPTVQFGGAQGFCTYTVTFTDISMSLVATSGGSSTVTATMNEAVVPPTCADPAARNVHTYTSSAVAVAGTTVTATYTAGASNKPQGTLIFTGTIVDNNTITGNLVFHRTDANEEILRWTVTVPITLLRH